MSLAPRPQDDLYRSVNHDWLESAEIPGDRGSDGAFPQLRDRAEADVKAIIDASVAAVEGGATGADDPLLPLRTRIAALWTSFMDTDRIEAAAGSPLTETLERIVAVNSLDEFVAVSGELFAQGTSSFVESGASSDAGDPSVNLLSFIQGGIGLPDEAYYREDEYAQIRDQYLEHLARLLELAQQSTGVQLAQGSFADAAASVLSVETALAAHHWDAVKCRDAIARYNRMSAVDLFTLAPELEGWLAAAGIERKYAETVDVWQPSYLEGLHQELNRISLADWQLWQAVNYIRSMAPYLSDAFVTENWSFYSKTLGGVTEQRPRWKRGVAFVEGGVGEDLGQLFVAEHFPPESKERMDDLVARLLAAYRDSITDLEWMSPDTREKALDKLSKFNPKIGYPVKWIDYSSMDLDPEDVLHNVAQVASFDLARELKKIEDGVDKDLWFMFPQTVNAYYHPLLNEIAFPAAILRPPFFDVDRDDASNFGAIGSVIGHEIGHGFDDQGSQFDGDGVLNNWWTDEDRSAFEQRTGALVAQYETLVPPEAPETHVNGKLTLGENIGDLGGLGIAHQAYRALVAEKVARGETDAADTIDGAPGDVRFFEANARVWATLMRPETMVTRIATDPHSPAEFRSNQVAKNLDAFHAAYGTKVGDGMWLAPEERVTIW
ncbi:MAG: M13 family metallopeptidase [Galactobacter sp.]